VPDGEPVFMVSSSSASNLVALLEAQTLSDMAREFPGWRIRRTGSGGWCASVRGQCGFRLVQSPTESPLRETLRAMAQHKQRACSPRLDHST
jgi:hypothetical protein